MLGLIYYLQIETTVGLEVDGFVESSTVMLKQNNKSYQIIERVLVIPVSLAGGQWAFQQRGRTTECGVS